MRKILLMHASSDIGGGSVHIKYLLSELSRDKYQLYIACPEAGEYYDSFVKLSEGRILNFDYRKFSIFNFLSLVSFIKKENFDLVHTHGKGAGLWGRCAAFIARKPVVHTFHGLHYKAYGERFQKIYLFLEKILKNVTAHFICVSNSELEECDFYNVLDRSKTEVIFNAIEEKEVSEEDIDSLRCQWSDSGDFIIGCIARFNKQKGHIYLLNAFNKLIQNGYNVKLVLVGKGELEESVVNYVSQHGLSEYVILTGFTDTPEIYYKAFDLFVLPSLWEGLPYTLIEALCYKVPVLATDAVGNREIIRNEQNGVLVKIMNANELYAEMVRFINGDRRVESFIKQGYDDYNQLYSLKSMILKLEDCYDRVLGTLK